MPTPPRSGLSSRNSIDGRETPRPAGFVTRRDHGLISPAKSSFSFADEVDPVPVAAPGKMDIMDENQISRTFSRNGPQDVTMVDRDRASVDLSRRKSQYYTEVFAYREPNTTARERVHQYSIITAEVKTNVIVKDEYIFLQDLSQHLSQRYRRPLSSIFITLNHSECLLFAGSFDSAYILTITALPAHLQPVTNKRNAVMIQTFMSDSLGVSPDRGIIRFNPISEEYLAHNGTTVLGEIENLSRETSDESNGASGTTRSGTLRRKLSRQNSRPEKLQISSHERSSRPGTSTGIISPPLKSPPVPALPEVRSLPMDRKAEKVRKMGRRRSFLAMFAGNGRGKGGE
ncbi:MAG: hypothetical protein LQ352_002726 [Teloschistes flavicans]|nr:MAG: hypothetical protein LQ352_002726 [Teloschistes flavicans]